MSWLERKTRPEIRTAAGQRCEGLTSGAGEYEVSTRKQPRQHLGNDGSGALPVASDHARGNQSLHCWEMGALAYVNLGPSQLPISSHACSITVSDLRNYAWSMPDHHAPER
jgi:hypothetical protein